MRLLGVGASVAIAAALALITVGLAGGPKAPFISWALPRPTGAPSGQHPAAAGHTHGWAHGCGPGAVLRAADRGPVAFRRPAAVTVSRPAAVAVGVTKPEHFHSNANSDEPGREDAAGPDQDAEPA